MSLKVKGLNIAGGSPEITKCEYAEVEDKTLYISQFIREILIGVYGCVSVDIGISKSVSVHHSENGCLPNEFDPKESGYLRLTVYGENDLLFGMDIRDNILIGGMITQYHVNNIISFINNYVVKSMKIGSD